MIVMHCRPTAFLREHWTYRHEAHPNKRQEYWSSRLVYDMRSKIPAAPMPPPTHIVTNPYRAFRRFISYRSVVVSLAPVHPRGWPSAMAPPLTLSRS